MRPCPACRVRVTGSVGRLNGFHLVRCKRCATLFTSELPSAQLQAHNYTDYYDAAKLKVPEFVDRRLGEVVDSFSSYRARNRWLDVGCGAGALLKVASSRGWQAVGTEVAASAVEALASTGLDARLGELEDLDLEPESFDVVSTVEVVEHVSDPGALLATASRLVRPGGALYVTTPHGRGISARLLGTRWSVIGPPEHLQLFSRRGLLSLITDSGFQVLDIRAEAVNPRELATSLLSRRETAGGERVESAYRLNAALSAGRSGRHAKSAINHVLSALRLGDALKATARRPA